MAFLYYNHCKYQCGRAARAGKITNGNYRMGILRLILRFICSVHRNRSECYLRGILYRNIHCNYCHNIGRYWGLVMILGFLNYIEDNICSLIQVGLNFIQVKVI